MERSYSKNESKTFLYSPTVNYNTSWKRTTARTVRSFDSVVLDLQEGRGLELQFPDTDKGDSLANAAVDISKKVGVEFEKQKEGSRTGSSDTSADSRADAYISRLRKSVRRRSRDLTREASSVIAKTRKRQERDRLQELLDDCRTIGNIVEG